MKPLPAQTNRVTAALPMSLALEPRLACPCGQPAIAQSESGPKSGPASFAAKDHLALATALCSSSAFRDYQHAFGTVTGLPLTLRPVVGWQLAHQGDRHQNGFCALLSRENRSCSACLQMQQTVCDGVTDGPRTMKCALGLHETAVAVKIGQEVIAYLMTGQIFHKPPSSQQTARALSQLARWGVRLNRQEAEVSYHATPVVRLATYQASVRLLRFFANQLGALANQIMLQEHTAEPEPITRARRFIEANFQEPLSLSMVAQKIGMSRFYFCKTFRKVTGINFTQYIKRLRVERAKTLLLNADYRISEIAYAVGFQSLTHFNRAFKGIAGQSPTGYRAQLSSC